MSVTSINANSTNAFFLPILDVFVLAIVTLVFYSFCFYMDSNKILASSQLGRDASQLLLVLAILVNQPHYSATYYRVYTSWTKVKRYFIPAVLAPAILLAVAGVSFMSNDVAAWFCKIYFLTVSYHYAGQTYGVALIYAHKARLGVGLPLKLAIGLPTYLSAFLWIVGDEVVTNRRTFQGLELPIIGFPSWLYILVMFLLVLSIIYYLLYSSLKAMNREQIPGVIHLVLLAQILWFTMAPRMDWFALFVPFLHCFQYLLITSYFQMQELLRDGKYSGKTDVGFFFSKRFALYYVVLVVVGLIIFHLLPRGLSWANIGSLALSTAIVHSFINIHHFILDGEIWKLRKPAISSLLLGR